MQRVPMGRGMQRRGRRGSWKMEMDASVALRRRPLKLITNAGQCLGELRLLWQVCKRSALKRRPQDGIVERGWEMGRGVTWKVPLVDSHFRFHFHEFVFILCSSCCCCCPFPFGIFRSGFSTLPSPSPSLSLSLSSNDDSLTNIYCLSIWVQIF